MKITFGNESIEVRPWGGEDSGKMLLMIRDESVKRRALAIMEETLEGTVQLMTDEAADEDTEGLMLAVVDRAKIALFFDLEKMTLGFCAFEEDGVYEEGET